MAKRINRKYSFSSWSYSDWKKVVIAIIIDCNRIIKYMLTEKISEQNASVVGHYIVNTKEFQAYILRMKHSRKIPNTPEMASLFQELDFSLTIAMELLGVSRGVVNLQDFSTINYLKSLKLSEADFLDSNIESN